MSLCITAFDLNYTKEYIARLRCCSRTYPLSIDGIETLEKLYQALKYLLYGDYFDTVLERMFGIALAIGLFLAIGYIFMVKPVILFYLLIAGMLVMGWFMMILLFPDFFHQLRAMMTSVVQFLSKITRR